MLGSNRPINFRTYNRPTDLRCANHGALRRHLPKGVIVHSDRGSQYCSAAYQELLSKHQLICSMSGKKGYRYDNAAMKSWNPSLKVEAIHGERFVTRPAAKQHVFEYIEVYYNL